MVNLRDFADAAALFAQHSALIIDSDHPVETEALEAYWVAGRRRAKSWTQRRAGASGLGEQIQLAEEMLLSEMPARVWTGVYYAHCINHRNPDGLRLARLAMRQLIESRQEMLSQMIDKYGRTEISELLRLDRLRRRVERWTDFLIGNIKRFDVALNVAFDPDNCRNNAASASVLPPAAWPLTIAGLSRSFPTTPLDVATVELQTEILRTQLSLFPPEAFHSDGRLLSAPLARLVNRLDRAPIRESVE